jgi:hypothetical protein
MQSNNLIAPIIVAIGVIIAAVAFAMVTTLLESADSGADLRITRLEESFDAQPRSGPVWRPRLAR